MLVQVEQHGIQFVFRAFDLSPQRKYGPVEYKWFVEKNCSQDNVYQNLVTILSYYCI